MPATWTGDDCASSPYAAEHGAMCLLAITVHGGQAAYRGPFASFPCPAILFDPATGKRWYCASPSWEIPAADVELARRLWDGAAKDALLYDYMGNGVYCQA